MLVSLCMLLLFLPAITSGLRHVRESDSTAISINTTTVSTNAHVFCPEIQRKNYTDENFQKGLNNIRSGFALNIVQGLKQSSNLVNEMASIGASQEAVFIAENLCQIAALTPDVSLVSDLMPLEQFKLLTTPKSFRGSLIQIIDNMCKSFLTADHSMNRVKLNLVALPTVLENTIDVLSSNDTEDRNFMLDLNLKQINRTATVCAAEADKVVAKFEGTVDMLQELIRGCTTCESNSKMEKSKKVQMKIAYENEAVAEKDYAAMVKKDEQDMRDRIKKTLETYDKQLKKIGSFKYLILKCVGDFLNALVRGIFGLFGVLKSGGRGRMLPSAGNLRTYTAEKQAYNYWNSIVSSAQTQVHQGSKEELFALLQTVGESEMGKLALSAVKKSREIIAKLKDISDAGKNWKASVNAALAELKTVVDQQVIKGGQQPVSGTSENGMAKGIEELRLQYELQSRMAEELREKMYESSLRLNRLISKMSTIDFETAELEEIIDYLQKGLLLLKEAKGVWIRMSHFFTAFKDLTADILTESIKEFTLMATKQSEKGSKLLEEQVLSTATHITAVSTAMHFCAETYAETSRRWIMPTISAVGKNLQLSKEGAKAKLSTAKERSTGQLCDVTLYLTGRMELAMGQSKKRTLDFIEQYGKGRS